MRREERVTVQGPVKKQSPDGMSHRGADRGNAVARARGGASSARGGTDRKAKAKDVAVRSPPQSPEGGHRTGGGRLRGPRGRFACVGQCAGSAATVIPRGRGGAVAGGGLDTNQSRGIPRPCSCQAHNGRHADGGLGDALVAQAGDWHLWTAIDPGPLMRRWGRRSNLASVRCLDRGEQQRAGVRVLLPLEAV